MAQAVFVVQPGNLSNVPAGSLAIVQASFLQVVNPDFASGGGVSALRAAAPPGAVLGAYWNAEGWRSDLYPGNPFWQSFAAMFPRGVACYPSLPIIAPYGYRAIRPDSNTGIQHARAAIALSAGFDFIYFDQSWRTPTANDALLGGLYAGGPTEFHARWVAYLEAFAETCRAAGWLVTSNCGGDPFEGFDAYTCESHVSRANAIRSFLPARNRHLNVGWFYSPAMDVPGLVHGGVLMPT